MPTGIFKQVLYGKNIPEKKYGLGITITIIIFSVLLLISLKLPILQPLARGKPYFLRFDSLFFVILAFLILDIILLLNSRLRKYNHTVNFILVLSSGYFFTEILYRLLPLKVSQETFPFLDARAIAHLNNFFLHRLFQFFPLFLLIIVFFSYRNGFENYFRFGNLSVVTNTLGKKSPQSWGKILFKFGLWIILILVAMIVTVSLFRPTAPFPAIMLFPIIPYALWNAFVEEGFFRGIFLPVLSDAFDSKWGNIIQALLFGLFHFSPGDFAISLLRLVLLSFLGWIFGKATHETKGLGTSWIIHSLIIIAIEIRYTVFQ